MIKINRDPITFLPVYLDGKAQSRLAALASVKGEDFSALVNDLLKNDIEIPRSILTA
ncbi:hypothetical protein FACS1894116_03720 [Betaproteobacteria bacterium]|nr:hypothetical protein FACS1894116_03720 [Betaproteobacteria bacterium]GHT99043.1 hypothetical protein FACS1894154_05400 [Betaproteobacteria bacterium]GHU24884.1 hypothetical protein FACS189488_10520 [Betaproteobacteria bacterium]